MSASTRLLPALLTSAALLAGCGGSDPSGGSASSPSRTAPAPSGEGLRVAATDLRLGDATAADRRGLRELRVGPRRVDAERLRRRAAERQGVGAGASCADADVRPDGANTATVIASTLCLLNAERTDRGLAPLAQNAQLADAALGHARAMVAEGFFSHTSSDGRDLVDRIRATGYIPQRLQWLVGENLAWGSGTLSTPRGVVAAWMDSPGHRENILRPGFDEIGFGVVTGTPRGGDGATYASNFGFVEGRSAAGTGSGSGPDAGSQAASAAPERARERGAARPAKRPARGTTARRKARKAIRDARRARARALRAAIAQR